MKQRSSFIAVLSGVSREEYQRRCLTERPVIIYQRVSRIALRGALIMDLSRWLKKKKGVISVVLLTNMPFLISRTAIITSDYHEHAFLCLRLYRCFSVLITSYFVIALARIFALRYEAKERFLCHVRAPLARNAYVRFVSSTSIFFGMNLHRAKWRLDKACAE